MTDARERGSTVSAEPGSATARALGTSTEAEPHADGQPPAPRRFPRREGASGFRIAPSTLRTLVALAVIVVVFSITSPDHVFLSFSTLRNVGLSAAEIVIIACGATLVLVAGQLDLSIGSQLLVSAIVGVAVMNQVGPSQGSGGQILIGLLVMLAVGIGFGLVNGLLTVVLRVPSFIVTLGSGGAGLGAAQLATAAGGSTSDPAPGLVSSIGLTNLLGVPALVLIAVLVAIVLGMVLSQTRFGLHIYATGSNTDAARRSGINTSRTVVLAFCAVGACSAVAAFIDLARFTAVSTSTHQSDALTALAGVIIGGASLYGGRGTILGTVLGTLVPVVLLQGFVIQGINPFWQNIAIGAVLVAAVALDRFDRSALTRLLRRPTPS